MSLLSPLSSESLLSLVCPESVLGSDYIATRSTSQAIIYLAII